MVTRILALIVLIVGTVTTTSCGLSDGGAPALVGSTDAPSIPLICCGCHHRVSRSDCRESDSSAFAPDFETNYYMWWANDKKGGCPGDYNYLVDQTQAGCIMAMIAPGTKIESQLFPLPSGDVVHCNLAPGGFITLIDGSTCP